MFVGAGSSLLILDVASSAANFVPSQASLPVTVLAIGTLVKVAVSAGGGGGGRVVVMSGRGSSVALVVEFAMGPGGVVTIGSSEVVVSGGGTVVSGTSVGEAGPSVTGGSVGTVVVGGGGTSLLETSVLGTSVGCGSTFV